MNGGHWTWTRIVVCWLVVLYMLVPLAIVLIISFSSAQFLTFPPPGFSLQWYENFFENPAWVRSLKVSVQIMIPTAVLTTALGTAAAFGLARSSFPGKTLVGGILMAPLVVPVIITAAAVFGVFHDWGLASALAIVLLIGTGLIFLVVNKVFRVGPDARH